MKSLIPSLTGLALNSICHRNYGFVNDDFVVKFSFYIYTHIYMRINIYMYVYMYRILTSTFWMFLLKYFSPKKT